MKIQKVEPTTVSNEELNQYKEKISKLEESLLMRWMLVWINELLLFVLVEIMMN